MYDISSIGAHIRTLRHQSGLTQNDLAEKLNLSYQAISNWENGSTIPDIDHLCKLAMIFQLPVDALLRNNQPKALIAVDGGGTKSEFALFLSNGQVIKRFKLEGTNASVYGLEQVIHTLSRGIDICLKEMIEIGYIFIGTAGPELLEIEKLLSERYPKIPIKVESDGVNALYSAKGDAALICGTGSILILKDGDGIRRVGGRGYMLGDPGSAYNFGRELLRLAASYEDGTNQNARLYRKVCQKLECTTLRSLKLGGRAAYIATLAPLLFEAFEEGDADAKNILHQEMKALGELINSACKERTSINLCGGMFEHYGVLLLPILQNYVRSEITFLTPALPPIFGACVRANLLAGQPCNDAFEQNFSKEAF